MDRVRTQITGCNQNYKPIYCSSNFQKLTKQQSYHSRSNERGRRRGNKPSSGKLICCYLQKHSQKRARRLFYLQKDPSLLFETMEHIMVQDKILYTNHVVMTDKMSRPNTY